MLFLVVGAVVEYSGVSSLFRRYFVAGELSVI